VVLLLSLAAFVLIFELVLPLVHRGARSGARARCAPADISSRGGARAERARHAPHLGMVATVKRGGPPPTAGEAADEANVRREAYIDSAEQEGLIQARSQAAQASSISGTRWSARS